MNRLATTLLLLAFCVASTDSLARGGFSSGGGRGGFSSSRSFSSPSRSFSSPTRSYISPRVGTSTTVTRSTTTSRSFGGGMGYHPMMYPGFGMGYGYTNGMLTGLILGNMMHPQGTVVYSGGGYSGNALLYPDGRVVNQSGYQVGTYANGQFVPMQNGGMVAQPAPPDYQSPTPTPVIVEKPDDGLVVLGIIAVALLVVLFICIVTF